MASTLLTAETHTHEKHMRINISEYGKTLGVHFIRNTCSSIIPIDVFRDAFLLGTDVQSGHMCLNIATRWLGQNVKGYNLIRDLYVSISSSLMTSMGEWLSRCELLRRGEQHGQNILASNTSAIRDDGRRMRKSSTATSENCTLASGKEREEFGQSLFQTAFYQTHNSFKYLINLS